MVNTKKKRSSLIKIPFITLCNGNIRYTVTQRQTFINLYCDKIYDRSKLDGPNTKKWINQKTWRANKLSGPNTKLGGSVPGRPTH